MSLIRYDFRLVPQAAVRAAVQTAAAAVPPVAVEEEAGRYVLRADLPGVLPNDIEITTEDGVLTLEATRRNPETNYLRRFTLPEDAASDQITARSSHGVLEIAVAKQPKVEPRRIAVEAA